MAGRKANSAYMLLGQIFGKAGLFVSLMIYSRLLSDGAFGELLFAIAISVILFFLSDMGASLLTTRRLLSGGNTSEILSSAFWLRAILSLGSMAILATFSKVLGYSSSQVQLLYLVFLGFVLDGFCETFYALFRAREKMMFEGLARVSQGVLAIVIALIIRRYDSGYLLIGFSYVFRSVPSLLICIIAAGRISGGLSIRFSESSVKKLFFSAIPLGLMGIILVAGQRLDNGFVKVLLSDSSVAAWQQCYRLFEPMVLLVAPTLLPGALFADLCKAEQVGWHQVVIRIRWMTEVFIAAAFVIIIPLFFVGMNVLEVVWGSEFLRGQNYNDVQLALRLLLLCLPVTYMFHIYLAVVLAQHRQKIVLPVALGAFILQMAGLAIFLPGRGIHIAAVMQLVFILAVSISLGVNAWKKYGVTGFVSGVIRPSIAFVAVVPFFVLQPFSPIWNSLVSLFVFIFIWLITGGGRAVAPPPY